MVQRLSHLHNAHNGCLDCDGPIFFHSFLVVSLLGDGGRDLDLPVLAHKTIVGCERRIILNGLGISRLGQDLELCNGESRQKLLAHARLQARRILDETQIMALIPCEEQQDQGLVGVHNQVMPATVELCCDGRLTQVMDPLQTSVLRLSIVVIAEDLNRLLHLRAQTCFLHLVGWPEASGQHCHVEVDVPQGALALRQLLTVILEVLLSVEGQGQVCQHTLQFGSKLSTTLHLQFGDHALLCIFRRRSLVEQTLGKLIPVDLCKEVFVAEEGKKFYHLGQQVLHLFI
mmetsp:Transcript_48672/g.77550  ORF Transcript_48672/g.77550 Transcript_48672/m.77550 type:complete len:287 (+) Transcript_48672:250-1110(+)